MEVGFALGHWPLFLTLLNVLIYLNSGIGYLYGLKKGGETTVANVIAIL